MKSAFLTTWLAAFCAAGTVWASDASPELDRLITSPAVWNESAADFVLAYTPMGFGYVSQQRDCARSVDKRLTFKGQRVWEALAYFETGAVKRIELSIYNRGDSGTLEEPAFQQLGKTLSEGLTRWAGNTGNPVEETTKDRANSVMRKHTWLKAPCAVQLTRAYVEPRRENGENLPFRAEFVKITLSRVSADMQVVKDSTTVSWMPGASTLSIKKNVRRSDTGDVWVDGVPMVDQGQKGYCAAAAAERLLRYYGRAVDQHQIAQLADTAAKEGTSQDGMIKALETTGQRFGLELKPVIKLDWNRLSRLIEEYNRAAKGVGKPALEFGHVIDVTHIYSEMDAALLRKVRVKQAQEMAQFKKAVKTYTGEGVPLLWSCIVGKFPEVPPINPPGTYGHMRLIIGYNDKKGELLYSDTWGAGHELKRIPFDDAWTVTIGLHVLKPR
jgi:hypothetical protein